MSETLAFLRSEILCKRKQLSIDYKEYYQKIINQQLLDLCKKFNHIAFYYPINGEVDMRLIWPQLQAQGKHTYLPKTIKNQPLTFLEFDKNSNLYPDIFDIPIPQNPIACVDAKALDLIVMPLLAADSQGHRIGMGGGFYDRTLAFKIENKIKSENKQPLLLGLAWDFQFFEGELPNQNWDVPLDIFLSENRCLIF